MSSIQNVQAVAANTNLETAKAMMKAINQEVLETAPVTKIEASKGDHQAIRKLAKAEAQAKLKGHVDVTG